MSRVEHLRQGLIAGVRDRSWRGRRERARQARRWAFLAEAGHLLEEALDFESTLERIASLLVPSMGDRATVDRIDPDATVEPEVSPTRMVTPLRARGRTLGAVTVISDQSGRRYDEEDLALLQELAARCALAADNARLYAEARDAAERLSHQAMYDPLTGLANRTLFVDRLERALARSDRTHIGPAVMFLDLDGFKHVNDTLGHSGGDQLLQMVAERLLEAVRSGDTVARMGGDEFTVLCDELGDEQEATAVADRIIDALGRRFTIGSRKVTIGASVGISLSQSPRDYPATLIREADTAMYQAKDAGRGRWEIFRESMQAGKGALQDVSDGLELAVATGGFDLAYEPVVDTQRGRVAAAEARVRWHHPTHGILMADQFLPHAEETGLIHALSGFVLDTAASQARAWCDEHPDAPPTRMLVDVSAAELAVAELPELVQKALGKTALDPSLLCLEITSRTLMDDSRAIANSLLALKGLGVGLAVERFGADDASL